VSSDQGALISFGPVPSRRLGRSLGINNIPPKSCSYSCIYCQVGPTAAPEITPRAFYAVDAIAASVEERVAAARRAGEAIDYLTFVPDGEPTLDVHLAEAIEKLRPLGLPIAVISNASLLWQAPVRQGLLRADWVSVKVDTVDEGIWRRLNRPHPDLDLEQVLEGIEAFARDYRGMLATETMLVAGVNDHDQAVYAVADYLTRLAPATAYLAVPTRPPTLAEVRPPDEAIINRAYQLFNQRLERVETLIGYEGDAFSSTGDVQQDLLAILAVHPMREEALQAFVQRGGAGGELVEALLARGRIRRVEFAGRGYFVRCLPEGRE
jgi:wyosine [tRNA(Phe)-imidazoG37] synthetase (radical SAM superfamily)